MRGGRLSSSGAQHTLLVDVIRRYVNSEHAMPISTIDEAGHHGYWLVSRADYIVARVGQSRANLEKHQGSNRFRAQNM